MWAILLTSNVIYKAVIKVKKEVILFYTENLEIPEKGDLPNKLMKLTNIK